MFNRHWSNKISENVKYTNLCKAERGIAPGRSPFGYIYDKVKKGRYIYYQHKCPDESKMVYIPEEKIFNWIVEGIREIYYSEEFATYLLRLTPESGEKYR